jgi:hypothetical protein
LRDGLALDLGRKWHTAVGRSCARRAGASEQSGTQKNTIKVVEK